MRRMRHLPEIGPVGSALVLTAVAGLVDAATYLALGGVFVANQTGNCVLLAIGIAERLPLVDASLPGPDSSVSKPLTSLVAFCAGAAIAGWLDSRILRRLTTIFPLLGTEALLLAAAAAVAGPNWARVGLAAAAMGVQSVQAAMRIGVHGVPTTVVTDTLTQLLARITDKSHQRRGTRLLTLAWLLYMAGAIIGAAGAGLWSFTTICWCAAAMTGLGAATSKPRSG